MWRPDIVDLGQFYAGPLGRVARRHLAASIRELWPDVKGRRVLGLGYATPFLAAFTDEAERVAALMPANQGVRHWPRGGPNRVALADELELPLPDQSFDLILVVHCLETSENIRPMLREIWRVLDASGAVLFVTPNRRGLWSRADTTPFGHGQPYTQNQLVRLLRSNMFASGRVDTALHLPPVKWRPVLRANRLLERLGRRLWPGFGGLVMVEAQKQVYAATPLRAAERKRRRSRAAAGAVAAPQRTQTRIRT